MRYIKLIYVAGIETIFVPIFWLCRSHTAFCETASSFPGEDDEHKHEAIENQPGATDDRVDASPHSLCEVPFAIMMTVDPVGFTSGVLVGAIVRAIVGAVVSAIVGINL